MKRILKTTFLVLAAAIFRVDDSHSQQWTKLNTVSPPPGRRHATAIHDPQSNRMILFGGATEGGTMNDVWSLALATLTWSNITPAGGNTPAPRFGHTAIYDRQNHRMIVWSGQGSGFYNDAWAFDLTTHTWQELTASGVKPNQRYGSAAVYDPVNHSLIIAAGFTDAGRFNDTQSLRLASNEWVNLTPAGAKPVPRCLHTASYDAMRRRMMLYAGQSSGALNDFWAFDLTSNTWMELAFTPRPPGRFFSSSVVAGDQLLIFGGSSGSQSLNDTWAFDLEQNRWSEVSAAGTPPEKRNGHTAVYLPAQRAMMIFGGTGASLYNDVWVLENIAVGVKDDVHLPLRIALHQNYPNPFNPSTTIRFAVDRESLVTLQVFDLFGRIVATLADERLPAGTFTRAWNARGLPSGPYYYRLRANGSSQTRMLILLK